MVFYLRSWEVDLSDTEVLYCVWHCVVNYLHCFTFAIFLRVVHTGLEYPVLKCKCVVWLIVALWKLSKVVSTKDVVASFNPLPGVAYDAVNVRYHH